MVVIGRDGRDVLAAIFHGEIVDRRGPLGWRGLLCSFTVDVLNKRGAELRCVYLQVWVISFNIRIINLKTFYT
jgi:hypothetical protein